MVNSMSSIQIQNVASQTAAQTAAVMTGTYAYQQYLDRCNAMLQQRLQSQQTMPQSQQNQDIYSQSAQSAQPAQAVQSSKTCIDGKDDGEIGFWEATKSVVVGAGKSVVNTVKSIVKNPLKLLATIGIAAACVACPAVGIALAATGAVLGGATVIKGAVTAASAKTDDSKRAAFEEVGAGGLQVALSVLGIKGGMKQLQTSGKSLNLLEVAKGADGKVSFANILKHPIKSFRATAKDATTDINFLKNAREAGNAFNQTKVAARKVNEAYQTGDAAKIKSALAQNEKAIARYNKSAAKDTTVTDTLRGLPEVAKSKFTAVKEAGQGSFFKGLKDNTVASFKNTIESLKATGTKEMVAKAEASLEKIRNAKDSTELNIAAAEARVNLAKSGKYSLIPGAFKTVANYAKTNKLELTQTASYEMDTTSDFYRHIA